MKCRVYSYSAYSNLKDFVIEVLIILIVMLLSVTGDWIYYLSVVIILLLKLFTSFRFYPILYGSIRIDESSVREENFHIRKKQLPLNKVHLYETTYHGLRYVIFSTEIISNAAWQIVARNKQAIVFPLCKNMISDFPALFQQIVMK